MLTNISNNLSIVDWAGCVPGVGTAVGFVEVIYYCALCFIDTYSRDHDPNIANAQAKFDSSKQEFTFLQKKIRAYEASAPRNLDPSDYSRELQSSFITLADKTRSLGEECIQLETRSLHESRLVFDRLLNALVIAMLRVTWIGGIGVCIYKALTKPAEPLTIRIQV